MNMQPLVSDVVEAMPDGVVIVDDHGLIVMVNVEAERMLGYRRDELLGQPVEVLLPDELVHAHVGHRTGFAADPHRRAMGQGLSLLAQRSDGSTFDVEISLAPAHIGGDDVVIASIRDVTQKRLVEAELADARQRVLLAEDHERIARDLHDTVIQRLFATGLTLQSLVNQVPEAAQAKIERVIDDQDDAIRELRTAIFGLSEKRQIGKTLRTMASGVVDESQRVLGYRPNLHLDGVLDTVDATITGEVVATLREALTNVAKHAVARHVDVSLVHSGDALCLTVADDGHGIPSSHRLGSGLLNMQDRAERLGGTCSITSVDNLGTTVRWEVPLPD
jgi:PAS domain S-box-containing protein